MKVAIVHYWFVSWRGGEKVVQELARMFPQADIYTHVLDRTILPPELARHNIRTTFINALPCSKKWYKFYLPLMPLALEQLDLRGYDLVISSESGPAKGVLTSPDATHICYCHTPMRYVWDMYHDYCSGRFKKALLGPLLHYLRLWDRLSADRVDAFVANSEHVKKRIWKHYRREAQVIYPPVDVNAFTCAHSPEDFYLLAGQLVPYKRADLAVQALTALDRKLVVIGEGEQLEHLRTLAGPKVTFMGRQPFSVLRDHYARCRALIFPGQEDFGLVPVEAMAAGRPVIAFGQGGALETVLDGQTGLFFSEQTVPALCAAVTRFEACMDRFSPTAIQAQAQKFSQDRFHTAFADFVAALHMHQKT